MNSLNKQVTSDSPVDTGLDYRKSPSAVEPFGPNSTKTPADTKTFGNSSTLPVKISAKPDT